MANPTRVAPSDIVLHLVDSEEKGREFYKWISTNNERYIAIDVETSGLQPYGPKKDRLRLVQFGGENVGWALDPETDRELIQCGLDYVGGRAVGHNSKFDRTFLIESGYSGVPQFDDTYIAHHLLYPLHYHGLKPAAGQLYGREVRAGEKWLDTVKRKNRWDWGTVPIDHPAYWGYSALDTVLTARLATDLLPEVQAKYPEQYAREVRVADMMQAMAGRGLRIDMPYVEALMEKWATEIGALRKRLEEFAIANPGSTAQISAALMNDGWEPDVLTETGKPSVNRAVLEGLNHEIAYLVLRWRRLTKWSKAYLLPFMESGGRIFPNVSSLRAATGRMSISDPPLQQLPKGPEVRNAIIADEGNEFWSCDFIGQEMRLTAAFAGDDDLTSDVLSGADVHSRIARVLHGPNFTKEQRSWTKNALYAYAYGAQSSRLALTAHADPGEAEKAIGAAYPAITNLQDSLMSLARARQREEGMAWTTTAGGRTVAVPKSRIYALMNYLMQGSGADMMKEALVRLDEGGLAENVSLVIHDEVLMQFPEGEGDEAAERTRRLMESEFKGVPFEADKNGPEKAWGDLK